MSITGLDRVSVEFVSDPPTDGGGLVSTVQGTLRKTGGGQALGPKGTMIECDAVVYLPHETNTHAVGSVRIDGKVYMIAFVDYGPPLTPLRLGLCRR